MPISCIKLKLIGVNLFLRWEILCGIGTIFSDFLFSRGGFRTVRERIHPVGTAKFPGEFSNTRLRAFPGYDIIKNN